MAEVTPEHVEQMLTELRSQATETTRRLAGAQAALDQLRSDYATRSADGQQQLGDEASAWLREKQAALAARQARRRQNLSEIADRLADALAPGPLGMPWDDPQWTDPGRVAGSHVRIGTLQLPGLPCILPAVVPLIGASGWVVGSSPTDFVGLAHSLVLRTLAAYGPNRVRVTAFDPGLNSDLGLYSELRQVDRLAVPPAINTTDAFEQTLIELVTHLGKVEDVLASQGLHSVLDSSQARQIRLLLIYSAAGPLSQRGAQNLAQVLRVGGPRGLFALLADDAVRALSPSGTDGLLSVAIRDRGISHSELPGLTITPDAPPERVQIQRIAGLLARRPLEDTAPVLPLSQLVDEIQDPWLDEGETGIEVAYGKSGRANLVLRLRSQDPPMPNAIIGGAVGEGKSNLLLTVLYGLAAKYSPQDLELVLVDLKDGIEFSRFAPDASGRNWLPHVRVLALEFDREFALKTLEWAEATVHDRGVLMRDAGASTIGEYRRRTGRPMPRILLVIDEFHRLFEGADQDVDRAGKLLESLARTARASGVHLILASQTISGIRGLASKSDAIFSQFHNRISLKNTAAESQAILAPRNVAAATLAHRGEVIAHEALGEDPSANLQGVVAYADKKYTRQLQQRLWTDGSTNVPPRIFRATTWAPRPRRYPEPTDAAVCSLAPGAPISVTEDARFVRVTRGPEQSVVILGSEPALVLRVLASCVHSALVSGDIHRVTILDGLSRGAEMASIVDHLLQIARWAGVTVRHVGGAEVLAVLAELSARNPGAATELVLPLGLDTLAELDGDDPVTYLPRTDRLRALLRDGGSKGLVVLGWWQSRRRAEEQLGYGLPGARGFALCDVGKEDLQSICGASTRQPEGYPRITWYDRSSRGDPEVVVPFELADQGAEVTHGSLG